MASGTTRRHSRDNPREDVGEDVGVGAVECELYGSSNKPPAMGREATIQYHLIGFDVRIS